MQKQARDEGEQLLIALGDKKVEKQMKKAIEVDSQDNIRDAIYGFYSKRLDVVSGDEEFKSLLEEKLRDKLENNELSIGQMMNLYKYMAATNINSTKALLDVLKPVPNAPNPMLVTEAQGEKENNMHLSMTSEEAANLDKTMRTLLSWAAEQEKKKNEGTNL